MRCALLSAAGCHLLIWSFSPLSWVSWGLTHFPGNGMYLVHFLFLALCLAWCQVWIATCNICCILVSCKGRKINLAAVHFSCCFMTDCFFIAQSQHSDHATGSCAWRIPSDLCHSSDAFCTLFCSSLIIHLPLNSDYCSMISFWCQILINVVSTGWRSGRCSHRED